MRRMLTLTWITILVVVFAVACTRPTPITIVITATPSPTETPRPTETPQPTATPVPLDQLDISSLLVQDGDLPAGYSGAQIRDEAPEMFDECPVPALAASRQFAKDEETAGSVTVLLYESAEDIAGAYTVIAEGMTVDAVPEGMIADTHEISEVGDKAQVLILSVTALGKKLEGVDLLFTRCQAVVHVRLSKTLDDAAVIAYGRRLDARLQPIVCRE